MGPTPSYFGENIFGELCGEVLKTFLEVCSGIFESFLECCYKETTYKHLYKALKNSDSDAVLNFNEVIEKIING